MKTKTTTVSERKGNYPHVSLSSNKIYKAPCSMERGTQGKENLATSCQASQNDFCKNEESFKDNVNEGNMEKTSLYFNESTNLMEENYLSFNGNVNSIELKSLPFNEGTHSIGKTSFPLNECTSSMREIYSSFNEGANSMGQNSLPFYECTHSMEKTSPPLYECICPLGDTSLSFNRDLMGQNSLSSKEYVDPMWHANLSFSGCTDSIVVTDSVLPSPSTDLQTLLPQQFETVKSEERTWAPQVDNSFFSPLPMAAMLDPSVNETCVIGYPSDELTAFDNSQNCVNLHDIAFPGTNVEGNMLFPTLENTLGVSDYNCGGPCQGFQQIQDPLLFDNLFCQQDIPFTEEFLVNYSQPDLQRVDHVDQEPFTKNFLLPSADEVDTLHALVNQQIRKKKNVTLVLDLDETLVHSSLVQCDADFTFQMITDKVLTVYVRKRPFLHEFLAKVSEMFEVIIFTASQSSYAAKLLDILDPDNKIFARRMYRESCTWKDRRCVKDLTVLGIDLAKVFIIDNTPEVFRFHVNNGIPIKSWYNDPSDSALLALLSFLEKLVDADDVRPIIAEEFGAKN